MMCATSFGPAYVALVGLAVISLGYGIHNPNIYRSVNIHLTSCCSLVLLVEGLLLTVINAMFIENWLWYQLVRGYYHSTDIGPRDINGSSIMTYNSYVFLAYMLPKCSGFISNTNVCYAHIEPSGQGTVK